MASRWGPDFSVKELSAEVFAPLPWCALRSDLHLQRTLARAIAINPDEAVVVRPYLCGTSGNWPLFAETFEALTSSDPNDR